MSPMPTQPPSLPPGLRLYAIGDIHGCLEQLKRLLEKIDVEAATATGPVQKIFLGDYIDRGLYSKQTIDFLMEWREKEKMPPIFLLGNHEKVFEDIIKNSDQDLLRSWFGFGGRETLMSYGINPALAASDPPALFAAMAEKISALHMKFLNELQVSETFGDYFFCHAGVRPGVDLAKQREHDLIWIRHEFLDHTDSYGKVVVHGHTISYQAEFKPNRIGVDTGAYATGRLTALGLEGTKQWLVQTG